MVRAVEQIAQEIAALDQTTEKLGESFQAVYRDYLTALGQAIQTQLVQAAYHVCTHGYPEQFIRLSLSQRQDLQQTLRRMGKRAGQDLLNCLGSIVPIDSTTASSRSGSLSSVALQSDDPDQDLSVALFVLDSLEEHRSRQEQEEDREPTDHDDAADQSENSAENPADGEAEPRSIDPATDPSDADPSDSDQSNSDQADSDPSDSAYARLNEMMLNSLRALTAEELTGSDQTDDPRSSVQSGDESEEKSSDADPDGDPDADADADADANPEGSSAEDAANKPNRAIQPRDIAHWQAQLEAKINELLQELSHATNQVLQKAKILPHRLPEPVLEVATKADLSSESTASPPNLLSLLIESETDQEKPSITQVMAIRLRLSEIEFGNSETTNQRSRLRQLMAQLSKVGREYQRKQREYAVAQAEAAWRSSWFEGD